MFIMWNVNMYFIIVLTEIYMRMKYYDNGLWRCDFRIHPKCIYSFFFDASDAIGCRFWAHFLITPWQCHWTPYAIKRSGPITIDCSTVNRNPPHGDIPEQIIVNIQLSKPEIDIKLPLWKEKNVSFKEIDFDLDDLYWLLPTNREQFYLQHLLV